jgi:hypothetical protein
MSVDEKNVARAVTGNIVYLGAMTERPRFHANDHSRDNLVLETHAVTIEDARSRAVPPSIGREGFALVPHRSAIADFRDQDQIARHAVAEVDALIKAVSGADAVAMFGPAILRFGERSPEAGKLDNSQPARFSHIDSSDARARQSARQFGPKDRPIRHFTQFNIWRAISPPPQDIPLAVCDAQSVAPGDLIIGDAVFDHHGVPEWTSESTLVRANPAHRWAYFSGMNRDEALVFICKDSEPGRAQNVPHCAFDDPSCPAGAPPRASIEMRAMAYWFA